MKSLLDIRNSGLVHNLFVGEMKKKLALLNFASMTLPKPETQVTDIPTQFDTIAYLYSSLINANTHHVRNLLIFCRALKNVEYSFKFWSLSTDLLLALSLVLLVLPQFIQ